MFLVHSFLQNIGVGFNTDLVTLGDIEKMGNVIKTRLENSGCKISEMYAVKHDKDESKLWNEYTMTYDVKFTTNHAHFLIKFSEENA